MRRAAPMLCALLMVGGVAGCGDRSNGGSPAAPPPPATTAVTQAPTRTYATPALTPKQLDAALVTDADTPPWWERDQDLEKAAAKEAADGAEVGKPIGCPAFDSVLAELEKQKKARVKVSGRRRFHSVPVRYEGEEPSDNLGVTVRQFATPEDAAASLHGFRVQATCGTVPFGEGGSPVKVAPLALPALGDEQTGMTVQFPQGGKTYPLEVRLVRLGQVTVEVIYFARRGPDRNSAVPMLERQVAKMEDALGLEGRSTAGPTR